MQIVDARCAQELARVEVLADFLLGFATAIGDD
jgi:hypothetical protein